MTTPDAGARDLLTTLVRGLAVVHGRVTLSSGTQADYYVDLRRVTLHHQAAPVIGRLMRKLTADWPYQAVGGLTLGADPVAAAMLHAARALGVRIVAEGVEEEAQAIFLRASGCDRMQGYWFARPMPADQMEMALKESHAETPRFFTEEPTRRRARR